MQDLTKEVEKTVDLLLKIEKTSDQKQKLLDKGKTVYLQITLFKTPFASSRKRKFLRLCHSLYGDEPEICLFVPNRKTGVEYKKTTDELIDFCVDYYTDVLEKHKVKGITTVMPLKQLKSEYGAYELRRKLVQRFDLFLCKNSLLYNSRFINSLGKIFRIANKEPLGVPFPKEDIDYDPEFQKNIERAIFTSSFYISPFSNNYSIPIGTLSNTKVELEENLKAVLEQMGKEEIIPGGFKNIRGMYLWPSQSKPVPLYISTELPSNMSKPRLKLKRKRMGGVEGELSTQPHKKVFVARNGDVFVTNLNAKEEHVYDSEEEEEDAFQDGSDYEGNVDDKDDDDRKKTENSKSTINREDSESEDDDEIEEKESRLMEVKRQTESNSFSKKAKIQNSELDAEIDVNTNKKAKLNNSKKTGNEIKKKKEKSSVEVKSKKAKVKSSVEVKSKKAKENGKIGKKTDGKVTKGGINRNGKSKQKKVKK